MATTAPMRAKAKVITEISDTSRNPTKVEMSGVRLGFPIAGRFVANGYCEPDAGGLLITCTVGAEGKCATSSSSWILLKPDLVIFKI